VPREHCRECSPAALLLLAARWRPSLVEEWHSLRRLRPWTRTLCRDPSRARCKTSVSHSALAALAASDCWHAVGGKWVDCSKYETIVDPMNGEPFIQAPDPTLEELDPFIHSLRSTPKTGLHNPWKNTERYRELGTVSAKAAKLLRDPAIRDWYIRLMTRVMPKSAPQSAGEVDVSATFLENFSGDSVRFMSRGFSVAGDHEGQESRGYRFPFGPVTMITPFNFSLEIPVLQYMGALYMGNKPLVHVDSRVSLVQEQFMRMLIDECGLRATDSDLLHCSGPAMEHVLLQGEPRVTLFTGSPRIAERLCEKLRGKVKIEDAGFDWKILGPDVPASKKDRDYVAWQCDQDAYAASGQKCSAQSILFMHENWGKAGLLQELKALASRRNLKDLTIGPVLSWTTDAMLEHTRKVSALPGAKLLFGGKALTGHRIPARYGAIEPTAVFVPIETMLRDASTFELVTTEVFGPFQVVTEFNDAQVPLVEKSLEEMTHHLTAGLVTSDPEFRNRILGASVNGVTYVGKRARTTGAPVNHWFGPAGDPRGAGIGSVEAIRLVWSCHREVVFDEGPVKDGWTIPSAT
jgi:1-pyrroline-5-carboxylate dehydrogenase